MSSKHNEILTVSFRPHYLPRVFGQITVILSGELPELPGPDNTVVAERLTESYNKAMLGQRKNKPVFVCGT